VLVIGGGMSGILTAIRLEESGISYTVIEKNDSVGGTWYENSYPDLRVDVPNHFYSYSFEPNPDWSDYFSRRDELEAYIGSCARKHGILEHVRFETEVIEATYDEPSARWRVRVRDAGGEEQVLEANAIISAVGMLNRPQLPSIEGLDSFEGDCFHSSHWQHDVDFEGKRVAVIDDSIVRGTTSQKIVKMIRDAGAKEVHLRIRSPPTIWPCFYGIDTPTRDELIAAHNSVAEVNEYITADSLGYLSLDGLKRAVGGEGFCSACFTGKYPVPVIDDIALRRQLPLVGV